MLCCVAELSLFPQEDIDQVVRHDVPWVEQCPDGVELADGEPEARKWAHIRCRLGTRKEK